MRDAMTKRTRAREDVGEDGVCARRVLALECDLASSEAERARVEGELAFERAERARAERAANASREDLARECETRDGLIRELECRVRELASENEALRKSVDDFAKDLDAKAAEIDVVVRSSLGGESGVDAAVLKASTELLNARRECETQRCVIRRLEKHMALIEYDAATTRTNMSHIELALAGKDDANEKAAVRLTELEHALRETARLFRECCARDSTRADEVASLRRALDAARREKSRLETELDDLAMRRR